MAPCLEFGVDQLVVYADLKPASLGGNESHALDLWFEILEQIIYQAHGPVSVVSNCAVIDPDFHCTRLS